MYKTLFVFTVSCGLQWFICVLENGDVRMLCLATRKFLTYFSIKKFYCRNLHKSLVISEISIYEYERNYAWVLHFVVLFNGNTKTHLLMSSRIFIFNNNKDVDVTFTVFNLPNDIWIAADYSYAYFCVLFEFMSCCSCQMNTNRRPSKVIKITKFSISKTVIFLVISI